MINLSLSLTPMVTDILNFTHNLNKSSKICICAKTCKNVSTNGSKIVSTQFNCCRGSSSSGSSGSGSSSNGRGRRSQSPTSSSSSIIFWGLVNFNLYLKQSLSSPSYFTQSFIVKIADFINRQQNL